jgi:hypothetical protein
MLKSLPILVVLFATLSLNGQTVKIERSIQTTGGTITDTVNGVPIVISLSTDDVEQENDEVDSYFDDDLDAGWEGDPADFNILTTGLRFTNLAVPNGAIIDSAYVVLHSHEAKSTADIAIITITAEATDNALTFDTVGFNDNYLLTDRPMTNASVVWTVNTDWVIWQPYKSANIASVIQEVVNRSGWQSGNAIALILAGQNQGPSTVENTREFESFENIADPGDVDPFGNPGDGMNHPDRVPELVIYYRMLGVEEAALKLVSAQPNPVTNGMLTITKLNSNPMEVEIYDLIGNKYAQFTAEDESVTISVANYPKGMYLIQAKQADMVYTTKVTIQ